MQGKTTVGEKQQTWQIPAQIYLKKTQKYKKHGLHKTAVVYSILP